MWKFYLSLDGITYTLLLNPDGTPYEPTGWDEIVFSLKRGPESDEPWVDGADHVFTNSLTFDGVGATILKGAYNADAIDAVTYIRITNSECLYDFDGLIDYADYKEEDFCTDEPCAQETVTIRIYKFGDSVNIKNRLDTAIDLSKQTGLDGNAITGKEGYGLKLHSKEIFYKSDFKINSFLTEYVHNYTGNIPGPEEITPPFEVSARELEETLEPSDFNAFLFSQPLFYSGFTYPPGVSLRKIHIEGRIKFTLYYKGSGGGSTRHNGQLSVSLIARKVTGGEITHTEILYAGGFDSNNNTGYFFDESFDLTWDIARDSNLFVRIVWIGERPNVSVTTPVLYENKVEFPPESFLRLSENSIITPSDAKVYTVFEAFDKIAESIIGRPNSFQSEFFENGCGKYTTITNGLNIRKMLDKDGNLYPVTLSFKNLFDNLECIWPLGMRIKKTDTGDVIEVEPIADFYKTDNAQKFTHEKIRRSTALNKYYNEYETGYTNWQTQDVNGLDEPNSTRSYMLPVKNVKAKLTKFCTFIAGGYLIEQTRRQQFKEKPTSDYATDNNIFIICTNQTAQTSDKYELDSAGDPLEKVYQPGEIAERNEAFSDVQNLLSPETAYNLRITPARMARWRYPEIKASLYKKAAPIITFQSGTGNYQLISTMDELDECKPELGEVRENYPIGATSVKESLREALYVPELLEFTTVITLDEFLEAVQNPTKTYSVACDSQNFFAGYIKSLNFRPNNEGSSGDFVLQRKS
jgi:hypothetical protein